MKKKTSKSNNMLQRKYLHHKKTKKSNKLKKTFKNKGGDVEQQQNKTRGVMSRLFNSSSKKANKTEKVSKTLYIGLIKQDEKENALFVIQDEHPKEKYLNSKRWVCKCLKTDDNKLLRCGCVLRDDGKVNADIDWYPQSIYPGAVLDENCYKSKKNGGNAEDTYYLFKKNLIQEGDIVGYKNSDGEIERVKIIKINHNIEPPDYTIEFVNSNKPNKQTELERLFLANIEIDMKPSNNTGLYQEPRSASFLL